MLFNLLWMYHEMPRKLLQMLLLMLSLLRYLCVLSMFDVEARQAYTTLLERRKENGSVD